MGDRNHEYWSFIPVAPEGDRTDRALDRVVLGRENAVFGSAMLNAPAQARGNRVA
jgi:hypothetical protein